MKNVLILPGDGIGKEVVNACLPIFKKMNLDIELKFGDIGWEFWENENNSVPNRTWDLIKKSNAVLLGATTSKPNMINETSKYISPIIQLRQNLDLYANVRPIKSFDERDLDLVIIRENTEGLYSGLDYYPTPNEIEKFILNKSKRYKNYDFSKTASTIRIISKKALENILEFSSKWAMKNKKKNIVIADKPNVFRESSKLIFETLDLFKRKYPNLDYSIENVDAVAMWIIKKPEKYEVIVCENQFGDILSDLGASLMGGLGVAYSGNFGNNIPYFEPVHGSAPKYANKNKANPIATMLSIAMMLNYLGYDRASKSIINAVRVTIPNKKYCTFDLGGSSTTISSANYIIKKAVDFYGK